MVTIQMDFKTVLVSEGLFTVFTNPSFTLGMLMKDMSSEPMLMCGFEPAKVTDTNLFFLIVMVFNVIFQVTLTSKYFATVFAYMMTNVSVGVDMSSKRC